MSKIQKALKKMQISHRLSSRDQAEQYGETGASDSMVVAQVVNRSSLADRQHTHVSRKELIVDRDALRQAGLIAPGYHEEMLANQYRDIKRPLIAHAFGKRATRIEGGNVIMVSSALAGEGKTFTSINLALSMARERDHTVLLVDADVAKPHTSEIFGAGEEVGILDAVENPDLQIESLILPTDVSGLKILPAGKPRHHATELLASSAMQRTMEILALRSEGQIVILDSPPLLQTSEAKVLAGLVGQIVLVIKAEETSQDAVMAALAALDEDTAVNLVLNQVRSTFSGYEYGYGYGAGYGQKRNEGSVLPTRSSGSFQE